MGYKKAVDLLKANNSKLAEQVDDLNDQQQAQQSAQMSQQYDHSFTSQQNGVSGNQYTPQHGGANGSSNSEMASQFNSLLSLQRGNQQNVQKQSSMSSSDILSN